VLAAVGLWETVLRLPEGVRTVLQSDGYPFSETETAQLGIAQAMAGRPRLLLIDRLLDELPEQIRKTAWKGMTGSDAPWTLLVATGHEDIASICDARIELVDRS
jgi:ABC-type protease/lipase transport system fused ATPase/permease subunit